MLELEHRLQRPASTMISELDRGLPACFPRGARLVTSYAPAIYLLSFGVVFSRERPTVMSLSAAILGRPPILLFALSTGYPITC